MTLLEYTSTIHYEYNNSIDKFQYTIEFLIGREKIKLVLVY